MMRENFFYFFQFFEFFRFFKKKAFFVATPLDSFSLFDKRDFSFFIMILQQQVRVGGWVGWGVGGVKEKRARKKLKRKKKRRDLKIFKSSTRSNASALQSRSPSPR